MVWPSTQSTLTTSVETTSSSARNSVRFCSFFFGALVQTHVRVVAEKEKKRVAKEVEQTKKHELAEATSGITQANLREVLQQVKAEPEPRTPEEKEQYFMTQVSIGEQLAAQGT